jgi:general nucleoside transport system permease protein
MHWGVVAAFIAVIAAYILLQRHMLGFQIKLAGQAPRAARFAGVSPNAAGDPCMGVSGRWPGWRAVRGGGPAGRSASISGGLRVYRDHRGLSGPAEPHRHLLAGC